MQDGGSAGSQGLEQGKQCRAYIGAATELQGQGEIARAGKLCTKEGVQTVRNAL
jgi:hypothetical protein